MELLGRSLCAASSNEELTPASHARRHGAQENLMYISCNRAAQVEPTGPLDLIVLVWVYELHELDDVDNKPGAIGGDAQCCTYHELHTSVCAHNCPFVLYPSPMISSENMIEAESSAYNARCPSGLLLGRASHSLNLSSESMQTVCQGPSRWMLQVKQTPHGLTALKPLEPVS